MRELHDIIADLLVNVADLENIKIVVQWLNKREAAERLERGP